MISWILLFGSGLALMLMFVRRLRMTHRDLRFQEHLKEEVAEEAAETPPEEPTADPKMAPPASVRPLFLQAEVLFGRNELDEAEALFLTVTTADPTHLEAHHKLGLLYMKRADFPQAELYFSKLVNLKKDPIYFSNLGAALYQQQRLVEAAEAYENAIALDDRRAERLQSLAQVYYELGNDEKALHYFERSARRKPKDLDLKLLLADYYERLGDMENTKKMLNEILELDPYNEEVTKRKMALEK